MVTNILNAAVAAAILATLGFAQDAPNAGNAKPKPERSQAGQQGDPQQPGQDADFALRARRFLATHPELRSKLRQEADTDGDGKLSPEELRHADDLLRARMADFRQREHVEQSGDRKADDGKPSGEQTEQEHKAKDRIDTNGDGKVEPRELERAKEGREEIREEMREHAGQRGDDKGDDHARPGRADDDLDGGRAHAEPKTDTVPQRGLPVVRRPAPVAKPATDPNAGDAIVIKKGRQSRDSTRPSQPPRTSSQRSGRQSGGSPPQ